MASETTRILVLCTGNRCRSQMAEGWLRHFGQQSGRSMEVFSAGTEPKGVHPLAITVMAEAGVDLSGQTSDHVDRYADQPFDWVVTVCDRAKKACPDSWHLRKDNGGGRARMVHHAFDDPDQPGLAGQAQLRLFRRVRDEIRDWARGMVDQPLSGRSATTGPCLKR